MIAFFARLLGLLSMSYYRGDGFTISASNVVLNLRIILELLSGRQYLEIQKYLTKPLKIQFVESVDDGISIKVFERRRKYFIIICSERPEVALARGLDILWRYLGNVGIEDK